jgi:26S proteasome regulatory subunit N2
MDEDNVIDTSKLAEDKEKDSSPRAKLQKEKVGHELENMSRVLPSQVRWISFPSEGRYQPVKKVSTHFLISQFSLHQLLTTIPSPPAASSSSKTPPPPKKSPSSSSKPARRPPSRLPRPANS